MKTAEEWVTEDGYAKTSESFKIWIQAIQSDAFHAGKLEGLKEAKEIVRCYGASDNVAEYTIETVCESLESKPEVKPKESLRYRPED